MVLGFSSDPILSKKKKKKLEELEQDEVLKNEKDVKTVTGVSSFSDAKTGQLTGISKGGKTYFGGNPNEIREALEMEMNKTISPSPTYAEALKKKELLETADKEEQVLTAAELDKPVIPDDEYLKAEAETKAIEQGTLKGRAGQFVEQQMMRSTDLNPIEYLKYQASGALGFATLYAQTAFSLYDNFRASLTGGETVDVREAKETFNRANKLLEASIEDIANGRGSESEVYRNLLDAYNANAIIQTKLKGKSTDNLRYWLRGGQDLQVEALNNEFALNQLRQKLDEAILIGRQRKIQGAVI